MGSYKKGSRVEVEGTVTDPKRWSPLGKEISEVDLTHRQ